jgi:hypothetical protein
MQASICAGATGSIGGRHASWRRNITAARVMHAVVYAYGYVYFRSAEGAARA